MGFLLALGSQGIDFGYAAALLVGGVIAAPFAAWLVRHMAPRVLGVAAGGLIVVTNVRTILIANGIKDESLLVIAGRPARGVGRPGRRDGAQGARRPARGARGSRPEALEPEPAAA